MKLNGRLKAIADLIPKSEILADIGTDHAYIPIYAVKAGICDKALAADIRKGPLEMALANIRRQGLLDRIELRLGSGLLPIQPSECETIVVAGMGGSLIRDILSASYEKAAKARVLLLQPNNTVEALRKWLCENGFAIFKETLAKDAGKLYCIISAKWTGVNEIKDKFTYFIGEKVFTGNDEHLKSYLKKKLNELEVIIEGRSRADPDKSRAFSDGDGLSTEECIIMRDRLREHLKEHI